MKALIKITLLSIILFFFSISISAQDSTRKLEPKENVVENNEKVRDFLRDYNNFSNEIIRAIKLSPDDVGVKNVLVWFETNRKPLLEKWKSLKDLTVTIEVKEESDESINKCISDIDSLYNEYADEIKKDPDMKSTLTKLIKDFDNLLSDSDDSKEKNENPKEAVVPHEQVKPFAYKIDELMSFSDDEIKQQVKVFGDLLSTMQNVSGSVICYDGINKPLKYKDNPEKIITSIMPKNLSLYDIVNENKPKNVWIYTQLNRGLREFASIEFFIVPDGADKPAPILNLNNLKLYDDSSLPPLMIQKPTLEIQESISNKTELTYPLIAKAAKAEGDVLVAVEINEKGKVINVQSFFGHPLLKAAAAQSVLSWTFTPEKRNKKPVKVIGFLVISFKL